MECGSRKVREKHQTLGEASIFALLGMLVVLTITLCIAVLAKAEVSRDLLNPLDLRRSSKATDARDKVYALLSIALDAAETRIIPDYNQSVEQLQES